MPQIALWFRLPGVPSLPFRSNRLRRCRQQLAQDRVELVLGYLQGRSEKTLTRILLRDKFKIRTKFEAGSPATEAAGCFAFPVGPCLEGCQNSALSAHLILLCPWHFPRTLRNSLTLPIARFVDPVRMAISMAFSPEVRSCRSNFREYSSAPPQYKGTVKPSGLSRFIVA